MLKRVALRYREAMVDSAQDLPDATAIEVPMLFERWAEGTSYLMGDRICYEETLYKCVQSHTSQPDWVPDITPNLWTRVTVEEWPEWVQPTGAQDAYMIGDKVSYQSKHWICTSDYNIYAPGVFGWDEVI